MASSTDIKYDFEPYDCTPGDAFDAFEERYLNNATATDDRGYSLADHVLGIDEGGPGVGAPAMSGLLSSSSARCCSSS